MHDRRSRAQLVEAQMTDPTQYADVDGLRVAYELYGDQNGSPVCITPGGRYGKDAEGIRELALELAGRGARVLIWDRPNTGRSDVCFDRGYEPQMQADVLAQLISHLGLGKATLIGGSNGSRVSMLTCARHPEVVNGLVLLWVSSGLLFTAMQLSMSYCGKAWEAAHKSGMGGVVALAKDGPSDWPTGPAQVRNRERMLAMPVEPFMELMEVWGNEFLVHPGSPVAGMRAQDFARIDVPTLVFRSSPTDLNHPRHTTELVHELIGGSSLVELPFHEDEWDERLAEYQSSGRHTFFRNWVQIAPFVEDFVRSQAHIL